MCGKCVFEAKFLEFAQPIAPRKKKVRKQGVSKKSKDEQLLVREEIAKCLMELVEKIEVRNDDDHSNETKGSSNGDTDDLSNNENKMKETKADNLIVDVAEAGDAQVESFMEVVTYSTDQNSEAVDSINISGPADARIDEPTQSDRIPLIEPVHELLIQDIIIPSSHNLLGQSTEANSTVSTQPSTSRSYQFFSECLFPWYIISTKQISFTWNLILHFFCSPLAPSWINRGISRLPFGRNYG